MEVANRSEMDHELQPITEPNGLKIVSQVSEYVNRNLAVDVQSANLKFGRGKNAHQALKDTNLSVPTGRIYGLLGPSGCGKTTLLNVIVGVRALDSGRVKVFGEKPGSKLCIVPGRGVGFMPQEIALYSEFTIAETLSFYGKLQHMDNKLIGEETKKLMLFLNLPTKKILVGDLSTGQQRRVSLASALIHKPPLLILDEPTVGVDPLLRQSIWNYLVDLTTKEAMTIIVTTHYIEEAGLCDTLGLMREGEMLTQESPHSLTSRLGEPQLEKCFLKLCSSAESETGTSATPLLSGVTHSHPEAVPNGQAEKDWTHSNRNISKIQSLELNPWKKFAGNTLSLFLKNMKRLRRNLLFVAFNLILPPVLIILVCLCLGPTPHGLRMAVVNEDNPADISAKYLGRLDPKIIHQVEYPDLESAMAGVKQGEVWGVIHFGPDFSVSLIERLEQGIYASNQTVLKSAIEIHMDMTNQQIGFTIQKTLFDTLANIGSAILLQAGVASNVADLPIKFHEPIYGKVDVSFTEFAAPSISLNLGYFLAMAMTVLSFVDERKAGSLTRIFVSGVSSVEILISQLFSQTIVLTGQIAGLFGFSFLAFGIPSEGPFILVILIMFLQGVYGMSFGLLLAALITHEGLALVACIACFYPGVVLCGVIWPTEGMPTVLRYLSDCLPQTIPTNALRAILSRGWGIEHYVVWTSFLVILGWIGVVLCLAIVTFRFKK